MRMPSSDPLEKQGGCNLKTSKSVVGSCAQNKVKDSENRVSHQPYITNSYTLIEESCPKQIFLCD